MSKEEFFEKAKEEQEENKNVFKERLCAFTSKVKMLDKGKDEDWTQSEAFKNIIAYIGKYPPVKLLKDILSNYTAIRHELVTRDIPTLMNEAGLNKLQASDGSNINIKSEISLEVFNKDKLGQWAVDHKLEDHIKETFKFGKGEVNKNLLAFLSDFGYSYSRESGIHPSTLKKIIKERLEQLEDIPSNDILKVKQFQIAKITY